MPTLYAPGDYLRPLTAEGRARTIAAFHVAQGNGDQLTDAEMRRDVLNKLMSTSAVQYWLKDKERLRVARQVGRVQMLQLTDAGLSTCRNSVNGGSDVPTYPELIAVRRRSMAYGGSGYDHLASDE